jgi:hypothetical protein
VIHADLPRAIRAFGRSHYGHVRFRVKARLKAWGLGPDCEPYDILYDEQRISAKKFGFTKTYIVPASALGLSEAVLARPVQGRIRRELGAYLREHGYLVEPGVEPEYRVDIVVTVAARVLAWPDTPGVTTPPWKPLGPEILVPWSVYGDSWDELRRIRSQAQRDNVWEFSVLCNPDEEVHIRDRGLVENICRVIPDERVAYGFLRPVERV